MRFNRVILSVLCSISLLGAAPASPSTTGGLGAHLQPCAIGKAKVAAQCGTFGVYENRAMQSGRIIQLHLIVIPAKQPTHHAIAEIAGGPGEAATEMAPYVVSGDFGHARMALHDTYDFIFMDDRGMGTSNPFPCNFAPPGDPASYFRYLFPPQLVASCRAQSAATRDMNWYNTNAAVDDLDDIRAALGYDRIVVDGGSYGTMFSLVYLRRHPEHVESAVLDGVAPPGFQPIPGEPLGAQNALDDLFKKCAGNASCRSHFPRFKQHFYALLQRFNSGPLTVPVRNLATHQRNMAGLSKQVFVDSLRHILYNPFAASFVPFVVERAYVRDYRPLSRMMQTVVVGFATDLNDGAYLNYSCSDMMPFISEPDLRYAAAHSYTGDLRIQAQRQACKTWNVPAMPASFNEPVRSDAPVLMLLGSDDPATPSRYGLAALKYLPNGRAVIVKGAGHGADNDCTDKLVLQFVQAHSAQGLDLNKCSVAFKLPPFATSMKTWPMP